MGRDTDREPNNNRPEWVPIEQLQRMLGSRESFEPVEMLKLFEVVPDAPELVKEDWELPTRRPGQMALAVPILRVYCNMSALKTFPVAAVVPVIALLMGQGSPVPLIATTVQSLWKAFGTLTDDQAELVDQILYRHRLRGTNAYRDPLPIAELEKAYVDATVSFVAILDQLAKKGVVVERGQGILLAY